MDDFALSMRSVTTVPSPMSDTLDKSFQDCHGNLCPGDFGPPGQKKHEKFGPVDHMSDKAIQIFWSGRTKINDLLSAVRLA